MSTLNTLEVGDKISFEVYPGHIYGNTFNNVTINAFFNYKLASALGFDVVSAHHMVYPTLPEGAVPNDPTQYNYIQIVNGSGETQILGTPWIKESSIKISNGKKLTLVFQDLNETRMQRIISAVKHVNENPDHIEFD